MQNPFQFLHVLIRKLPPVCQRAHKQAHAAVIDAAEEIVGLAHRRVLPFIAAE